MEQLERKPDAVDETPNRSNESSRRRPDSLVRAMVGLVSEILGVCGFLYGAGWALLPSSTLSEKVVIFFASITLTAAFILGIGAWQNTRRFTWAAISVALTLASLAYLSIVAQNNAAIQLAQRDASPSISPSPNTPTEVSSPVATNHATPSTAQTPPTPTSSSRAQVAPANAKPLYLTTLTGAGDAWQNATWSLAGKVYSDSLGVPDPCSNETSVTYHWTGSYRRFIAEVGITDAASPSDQGDPVDFTVYADANEDNELGAKSAQYNLPADIDLPLQAGETSLTLDVNDAGFCEESTAVWGDARLMP